MTSESELAWRRPTWAEIDLDALASNFRAVCERVGAGVKVMGVVKADAYGHGAPACARRLAAEGAEGFGVATAEEAFELRGLLGGAGRGVPGHARHAGRLQARHGGGARRGRARCGRGRGRSRQDR